MSSRVKASVAISQQGNRPAQEDFAVLASDRGVFVVADGFGGPVPGPAASRQACEAVRSFLIKEAGDREATLPFVLRSYFSLAGNVLFNALVHANHKVLELNQGKGINERGGASVLAGFLDNDLLALASVGSCTAWLFRKGRAVELVLPRTYGRLVDPYSTDLAEELQVPLMAVGMAEDLEPEIFEYRVQERDWLLLVSSSIPEAVRTRLCELQMEQRPSAELTQSAEDVIKGGATANMAGTLLIF